MKNVLRHITPDFHCIEVPFRVIDKTYSEKFSEEYLWCEPLNEQPNCAKVVSIPYTLYGINPNDKITYKQLNGRIVFGSLVEDGGTYTYRIAIADSEDHKKHVENKKKVISLLEKIGVDYDEMNVLIIAVSVKNRQAAINLENALIELQLQNFILGYDTSR